MEITWLGHGAFQFRLATGEVYLVDPWLDGNPSYPAGHSLSRLDFILLTHGHSDHFGQTPELAQKHGATVISNFEIATYLESKGVSKTVSMNKGGAVGAGPLRATMTHALHSSSIQDNGLVYAGEPAGFVLTLPGGSVAYFAGDTSVFSDMALIRELYAPELAFLPIGDVYTMGPREAALAVKLLQVDTVIPMHFGTFPLLSGTPAVLAELTASMGTKIWTLEPGVPVDWGA